MLKCPHCAEIIKSNAKKCKYCGESVIETNLFSKVDVVLSKFLNNIFNVIWKTLLVLIIIYSLIYFFIQSL